MLHYYIQLLTKSWWPNGQLVFEASNRTAEEKLKTKEIARAQFLNSIPDVLINLVGAESAQQGFSKIFDALQNEKMNKQLFYVSNRKILFSTKMFAKALKRGPKLKMYHIFNSIC